jgi:hypothetical protein
MFKLLTTYRANPTLENARLLCRYNDRHPMAACFLTIEDAALLRTAIAHFVNAA